MCGGVNSWVDYGCPHDGVSFNQGSVRVDEVCWVPCYMLWADLGGFICEYLRGYGGVRVLVGLTAVEIGGVG